MRRVFGWLLFVVALGLAATAVVSVLARFHDGPLGPIPGGPFEASTSTVAPNLAALGRADTVEIEVGQESPLTRTTWILAHDGFIYIPAGMAETKSWPEQAEKDGSIRLRSGSDVYRFGVAKITDPSLRDSLLQEVNKKYGLDGKPEDAMAQGTWFFRLDPPVTP